MTAVPMRAADVKEGDRCGGRTADEVSICRAESGCTRIEWSCTSHASHYFDDLVLLVERPEPPLTADEILAWVGRAAPGGWRDFQRTPDGRWRAWPGGTTAYTEATPSEAVRKAMAAGHE